MRFHGFFLNPVVGCRLSKYGMQRKTRTHPAKRAVNPTTSTSYKILQSVDRCILVSQEQMMAPIVRLSSCRVLT